MLTQALACVGGRLRVCVCLCVRRCWGLPGLLNGGFLSLFPRKQTEAPQRQQKGLEGQGPPRPRTLPGREAERGPLSPHSPRRRASVGGV